MGGGVLSYLVVFSEVVEFGDVIEVVTIKSLYQILWQLCPLCGLVAWWGHLLQARHNGRFPLLQEIYHLY